MRYKKQKLRRHEKIENNPLMEQLCEDLNNSKNVRDLALFCGLYIDYFLNELIIKSHNKNPKEIIDDNDLGNYSSKTKILHALGIINELIVKNIKIIGEIRNYFAHHILMGEKIPEKIIIKIKQLDYLYEKGEIGEYDFPWEDHENPLCAQLQVCGSQIVTVLQTINRKVGVRINWKTNRKIN